uniref:formylglycine-generating enzyme family protein n=1 Tax=Pararhizobium sp. IMCC3301 TaxID=3067904 RepID=UPI0027427E76|nr:formylglycine-generating enzyme family protein [Pararhizobium sp. IMCC3301]
MPDHSDDSAGSCCPHRSGTSPAPVASSHDLSVFETAPPPRISIEGGMAQIGTDKIVIAEDEEGPPRSVTVKAFQIDATTVTNQRFRQFVDATGYVTEAERFGWSFVFYTDVPEDITQTQGVLRTPWWRRVDGADWRRINGPETEQAWHPDHPVVQVSWNDANAFAHWAQGELPSEAQWEHAARGGRDNVEYPWGNRAPDDDAFQPCNIWQGRFPETNSGADGYLRTAPAQSFAPNDFGLYNMCGNVWEWTRNPYRLRSLRKSARARERAMAGYKISKGGSFMCHVSYCFRYRIAARNGNSPDSTSPHQGFRLVYPG